ncbi:MAG TPA: peptidase domain-containing ABC transporter [Steroidobacteraceae bacterium]|nr:peptidase domain-containing ABC transporter [Steroidobacteraceae bacterium]
MTLREAAGRLIGSCRCVRKRLPLILQTEAAECGLACLAMISGFHGHELDLPRLRRITAFSMKGTNLKHVIDTAEQLALEARPLRLELGGLSDLRVPCILHWDLNHFVILKQIGRRTGVVHDPAFGVRRLSMAEISQHFSGVALELWPAASFKSGKDRTRVSLRALAGDVSGLKRALAQIFALSLSLEVLVLVGPFYLQCVLDKVLPGKDAGLMVSLGVGFIMLTVFQVLVTSLRSWSVTWLSASLSIQWSGNLFGHLIRLPLAFFEKRHAGDIVSRFNSVQTIQHTVTNQSVEAILEGLMSALILALMWYYSIVLTGLAAAGFVLYGVLRWSLFGPIRRTAAEQIGALARQETDLLESIRGILPLKLANQEGLRRARYTNRQVDTTNCEIAVQRLNIGFQAGRQLILGVARVGLIWLGTDLVLGARLTVGMLIAFLAYAEQFSQKGADLIDKWHEFRMLGLHTDRLADIALTPKEGNIRTNGIDQVSSSRLEVSDLWYRYAATDPWVIEGIGFTVEPGESVAIAAPSGAGKTTLAKLVLGLLTPTNGKILFGGVDIKDIGAMRYREMVAAVMQDDQLFAGSIADNISMFAPDAVGDEVESVARLARIHDDIVRMPMGYQTLVGDMGSALSGGQRQRVLLARALYRRPRFLVLDEATSHLDVVREREINHLISGMSISRLVLAHRPETLASADRVIVLGRAKETPDGGRAATGQV